MQAPIQTIILCSIHPETDRAMVVMVTRWRHFLIQKL